MARSTSHGPGRKLPSQVSAAPRSATTSGWPDEVIVPSVSDWRYGPSSCSPCVVWPIRSPSTRIAATSSARSASSPARWSSCEANARSAGAGYRAVIAEVSFPEKGSLKSALLHPPGDTHDGRVHGRPRRLDLVRRQARTLARRHHPRADSLAPLRPRRVRGRARLQDGERHGDLPTAGAHRSPLQLGAHLHDEDPVHAGAADRGAEG